MPTESADGGPAVVHHLDNVRELRRRPPTPNLDDVDIDELAEQLTTLVDLGRVIAAKSAVVLVPAPELVLAGQRVEHIAERVYRTIFGTRPHR
jgi:hypothetical protein